ncbi:hypothetical protein A2U01_0113280, partial [Trifolium medium]|nr:hypothetical protein [Trifolium medium]
TDMTPNGEVSD